MPIIKCPECGHQVSSLATTCPSCGVAIAGNIVKCPQCGGTVLANQEVCPNCLHTMPRQGGKVVVAPVATTAQRVSAGQSDVARSAAPTTRGEQQKPSETVNNEQPPRRNKMGRICLVAFVIALAIVFTGYYFYSQMQDKNELAAYENAMESTEPAVLQNYLDMYPDAPQERRDSISAHLELLKQIDNDWYNALASQSAYALERYVQQHPESVHATEARFKIDSLDWVAAANQNTIEAYKKYMDKHSDGEHVDDAKMNYDKLSNMQVSAADIELISGLVRTYLSNSANREILANHGVDIANTDLTFADDWDVKKQENEQTGAMDYQVAVTVQATSLDGAHTQTFHLAGRVTSGRLVEVRLSK